MSKKNQNFKNNPDMNIINTLLKTFGLTDLNDDRYFTKENMKEMNTVNNINLLIPRLEEYYLPCKAKIYLKDLTEKKSITILRQFIKNYNYKLITFEKSIQGRKQLTYRLMYINSDSLQNNTKKPENTKYIVTFDS
tara:strand:- start:81 stop:488 length:408 start_codon:yes stop_codon:yes gene_type:complete